MKSFAQPGWSIPKTAGPRGHSPLLIVLLTIVSAAIAQADVIILKNGHQIVAHVVKQDSYRAYYERCGAQSSVAWSDVERVDAFSDASGASSGRGSSSDAGCGPAGLLDLHPEALAPVVKDDVIDEDYLAEIDARVAQNASSANRRLLAREYEKAAYFLTNKGDATAAVERVRHALELASGDESLTLVLGGLYLGQNRESEAVELLEPAVVRAPRSAGLHFLLGWAYYSSERLDQSIAEWKKGLALHDNPEVRGMLARMQKEQDVTKAYQDLSGTHFLLSFQGGPGNTLGGEVLRALEADYRELETDLQVSPNEKVVVLLYPNQDFRDITRSPAWVGALNDGKIRVPISGLTGVTPELARVLKHELTHSFVRQATLGRCPVWFNEGLAQLEDGSSTHPYGKQLVQVFGQIAHYAALQRSFISLPAYGAAMIYAKSLAGLEYLRDQYGWDEIRRMLGAMGANPNFDAVLQLELRSTYPMFEESVQAYLQKLYGS